MQECDLFLLVETRELHSMPGYFSYQNRLGTRVCESLLSSQRESALFVVPDESWFAHFLSCDMDVVWRLKVTNQIHQRVSPFLHDRQTTNDLTTNFLQESGKLVYGPLVLLAPEWTVVKRVLCRWCSHWSPSHASSRACCRWRTPAWKFQWSLRSGSRRRIWAHNLWEGRCWPKSQAPHSRFCTGEFSPNRPTWKMKMKIRRMKQKMRETGKGQSGESKRGQNAQPHETWMTWRALHLEPMSRATLWNLCANTRKCDVWGCFLHIECNPSKHDQGMM